MANKKEKIALFDFCDTLVSFQTANEYVRFYVNNYATLSVRWRHFIYLFLSVSGIISRLEKKNPIRNTRKRILLWQLKGCSKDKMEMAAQEYYEKRIKPNLIRETIVALLKCQKEGRKVIIVSGGYDIYIKYFAREYGIAFSDIISNQLLFNKSSFVGKFDLDCMREEKVKILRKRFVCRDNFDVEAYSDSESDLPMLQWADIAYVVTPYSFAKLYNFYEIRYVK